MSVVGRWRIVDMERWDQDAVDLVAPGFIEFEPNTTGSFGLIAVQESVDWRQAPRDGRPGVEFSWAAFDEGDPDSGRGWAMLDDDGCLRGHLYFHYFHVGDDSGFQATRVEARLP
jgi:hypothetical protein